MDADGLRYAGRGLRGDGRIPAVQEVVRAGLGDSRGGGQCSHGQCSAGGSLHELAEEVTVGQAQACVCHGLLLHPRPWMWIPKHTACAMSKGVRGPSFGQRW